MSFLTMIDEPLAQFFYELPIIDGLQKYTLIFVIFVAVVLIFVYWLVTYVF